MRCRPPERHCCDGQCLQGCPCPAFAPGVIQGPYWRRHPVRRAMRALGDLLAVATVALLGTWAWAWMGGWR